MLNHKYYNKAKVLAKDGELFTIFNDLIAKCKKEENVIPEMLPIRRKVENLKETYFRMRQFLLNGFSDDQRFQLYDKIREDLLEQIRNFLFIKNLPVSTDSFFALCRIQQLRPDTVSSLLENYNKTLFYQYPL